MWTYPLTVIINGNIGLLVYITQRTMRTELPKYKTWSDTMHENKLFLCFTLFDSSHAQIVLYIFGTMTLFQYSRNLIMYRSLVFITHRPNDGMSISSLKQTGAQIIWHQPLTWPVVDTSSLGACRPLQSHMSVLPGSGICSLFPAASVL